MSYLSFKLCLLEAELRDELDRILQPQGSLLPPNQFVGASPQSVAPAQGKASPPEPPLPAQPAQESTVFDLPAQEKAPQPVPPSPAQPLRESAEGDSQPPAAPKEAEGLQALSSKAPPPRPGPAHKALAVEKDQQGESTDRSRGGLREEEARGELEENSQRGAERRTTVKEEETSKRSRSKKAKKNKSKRRSKSRSRKRKRNSRERRSKERRSRTRARSSGRRHPRGSQRPPEPAFPPRGHRGSQKPPEPRYPPQGHYNNQGRGWRGELPNQDHPRWRTGTNKGLVRRAKQTRFNERKRRQGR